MMSQQQVKLSASANLCHQQLMSLIKQKINQNQGRISFSEFMQLALYAPELGYYQNGLQKFGEQGDFVTAPEMGDLFARGIVQALLSQPDCLTNNILEIGAGSGVLAADILGQLASNGKLPESYSILEPSASLQSLQYQTIQQKFPELLPRVNWLAQLPEGFTGTILANEVLDAIPCERIIKTQQGWQIMDVVIEGGLLSYRPGDQLECKLLPEILQQNEYSTGYITEIRPLLKSWIKGLAKSLQQGLILLFDYGYPQSEYYHPQRIEGSLRCFTRHQAHSDALSLVGVQDITAHVDFTDVASSAVVAGLSVNGFTTQAGFLLENGILNLTDSDNENSVDAEKYRLSQQIQKLTAPGQMGEVIKVISLGKGTENAVAGFSLQDQLHRL